MIKNLALALALLALAFALPGAETRARALALLGGWRLEEAALAFPTKTQEEFSACRHLCLLNARVHTQEEVTAGLYLYGAKILVKGGNVRNQMFDNIGSGPHPPRHAAMLDAIATYVPLDNVKCQGPIFVINRVPQTNNIFQ